ncbi:GAF domain-containing protein [Neglectibacter caecimuris]|uniref:GAF domain-containing protein n=1 Tax=Neglectibacter caecimuris TaxID=3093658 RepID=UPI002AC9840E|nr:GAF domain-containing protein [Neglectibacter sp. M00184]
MSDVTLLRQAEALIEGERRLIPNLANLSALLWERLETINWVGFYLMEEGKLLLGPFQGKPACIHIPLGKGVCGTAAAERKTLLVPEVHEFSGHIACDSASRSELVVPLLEPSKKVLGVLDIDSPLPSRFTEEDARAMEKLADFIVSACDWSSGLQ